MEDARVCSSLPDCQAWPSMELPLPSRPLEEAIGWGEIEELVNNANRKEEVNTPQTGENFEEPEDNWDSMMSPVYTMTSPSVPLNFATVQWDMPDPSSDLPSPINDNSSLDELDCSGAASMDWTLSPLSDEQHQSCVTVINLELSVETYSRPEQLLPLEPDPGEGSHQVCDPTNTVSEEAAAPGQLEDQRDSLSERSQWVEPEEETGQPMTQEMIRPTDRTPSPFQTEEAEAGLNSASLGTVLTEKPDQTSTVLTMKINAEKGSSSTDFEEEEEEEEEQVEVHLPYDEHCEHPTAQFEENNQSDSEESEVMEQLSHTPEPVEWNKQSELKGEALNSGQSETNRTVPSELKDSTETTEQPEQRLVQSDRVEHSNPLQEGKHPSEVVYLQKYKQSVETAQPEQSIEMEQAEESIETEQAEQSIEKEQAEQSIEKEQAEQSIETEQVEQSIETEQAEQSIETEQAEQSTETEQAEQSTETEQAEQSIETEQAEQSTETEQAEQSTETEQAEQSAQNKCLKSKQSQQQVTYIKQPEFTKQTEVSQQEKQSEQAKLLGDVEQSEHSEQVKESKHTDNKPAHSTQLEELFFLCREELKHTNLADQTKDLTLSETNQPKQTAVADVREEDEQVRLSKRVEQLLPEVCVNYPCLLPKEGSPELLQANVLHTQPTETVVVHMNGGRLDREKACRLAERLYRLDGINKTDVVKHLDKDNDFSRAVGEEYLKFFDFTGQSLDQGLRCFLKVVVLIGETQERERVLQHFSSRYQHCNPETFSSSGEVLTLTCAVMLLNSDLHGQNVGKAMSMSSFVSNLGGMNEGSDFNKDLLKALYNSIKSEPLQWAVNEKELKSSMLLAEDAKDDAPLRSKSNPFQDVPHDKKASVFKQGFLKRKAHADIDGKRTPWGKRSWKTFYGVLKGMVLYLLKDEYKVEWQSTEEVVSVHHALAERAADYTKRPHVFRLQTADWRVFLFQASSSAEMGSWINRINLVSALHSSPPFPAAVGSQRRFCRPILPASQSEHTLEQQLQSHVNMLESFKEDLAYLQQSLPEGRRAKTKELEEHRVRDEYLQHEKCRYETYIQMLDAWKVLNQSAVTEVKTSNLNLFDEAVCNDTVDEEEDEGTLKKSHSSPSLVLEMASPPLVKVKRNVSERRTYRKIVIPRRNQEI